MSYSHASFSHAPVGFSRSGSGGRDAGPPHEAGRGAAAARRPVTWLHGVGYTRGFKLMRAGVRTVDDIARAPDAGALAASAGLSAQFVEQARIKARSAVEDRVIQRRRLVVPPDDGMAVFDIETDIGARTVWLIGVLYRGRITQFMADASDGERGLARVLSDFVGHLGEIGAERTVLASYSGTGFDTRVVAAALARHGIAPGAFGAMRHVDLCTLVRRSFAVPGQSYSLKSVGAALGYRFAHAGMDGLDAALAYERHRARGVPIDPAVLEYNRDDVLSVRHVIGSLEGRGFDVERRASGWAARGRRPAARQREQGRQRRRSPC